MSYSQQHQQQLLSTNIKALSLCMLSVGLIFGCSKQPTDTTSIDTHQTPTTSSTQTTNITQAQPGKGISIQAVQSPITEEGFQTEVINLLLAELGYSIQPTKEADYGAAYLAVANGDATFMAVNWYPHHGDMYENAGGDAAFYREGTYITGAAQGYLIDKKTADKYQITNLDQLKNPKIAALFDYNKDGKADLVGCQAGWGCEKFVNHQINAYGLTNTVTHHQGQYNAMMADLITRYNQGESVLYYTWTPYWVSGVLKPNEDVVWLQVPFSANPYDTNTELENGKNYGFMVSDQRIVANKDFAAANPAAATLFKVAKLPVNAISAENLLVSEGEDSNEQVKQHAQNWINANRATVDDWLGQARAASITK